jgi:hypothetical protein
MLLVVRKFASSAPKTDVARRKNGRKKPGRDNQSLTLAQKRREGDVPQSLGFAELHLGVADARILRSTRERVALLDRDLVFRIALVSARFFASVSLLRCRPNEQPIIATVK